MSCAATRGIAGYALTAPFRGQKIAPVNASFETGRPPHVSGTDAICSLNAGRDEIAAYQRSRLGVDGRSGMSCT